MNNSDLDQITARGQLLIAERHNILELVAAEQRPFSDDELKRITLIDGAITAISNALARERAAVQETPSKLAPNRSDPGSDYRVVALAYYEQSRSNWMAMNQLVAEYGKWMIATIAASHLGGIYFIGGISEFSLAEKEGALWALVAGLVLVFLAALTTYYNWQFGAEFYAKRTNVNALIDPTASPSTDQSQLNRIHLSYIIAIAIGVISVACIPIAATLLSWAARAGPPS